MNPLQSVDVTAADLEAGVETLTQTRTERLSYFSTVGERRERHATRAIGYIRVSTQEQADSGAGLAVQRAAILRACDERSLMLTQVLSDGGASAASLKKRPGLAEAIDQLRRGNADVLVVSKLDRLSRSVIDFAGLLDQAMREGWQIVVLDIGVDMTTPHGRFIAHVMSASAQWERELIGLRTKEALAVKKAQGVAIGRPHSVPSDVVRQVEDMRSRGYTYSAIADALNEAQVPRGRGGARWYPSTVRGVLWRKRATCA